MSPSGPMIALDVMFGLGHGIEATNKDMHPDIGFIDNRLG